MALLRQKYREYWVWVNICLDIWFQFQLCRKMLKTHELWLFIYLLHLLNPEQFLRHCQIHLFIQYLLIKQILKSQLELQNIFDLSDPKILRLEFFKFLNHERQKNQSQCRKYGMNGLQMKITCLRQYQFSSH